VQGQVPGGRRPELRRGQVGAADMGDSIPVTQTSPSPWAAWASPHAKRAPFTCTGSRRRLPRTNWRVSMLPPNTPGGMIAKLPASAGATPMVPRKGWMGMRTDGVRAVDRASVRSKIFR